MIKNQAKSFERMFFCFKSSINSLILGLVSTPILLKSSLIREDKIYQIPSIIQAGGQEGMQSLDQDLQRLVSQGIVDKDEAKYVADNPELFEKAIF